MMRTEPYRVLYISYDGMTDPLGQSQVLPYLCGLAQKGYHFTLVSCEKTQRFVEGKTNIEQIAKQNDIEWQPLSYTKSPPILSTIQDIRRMRNLCIQLHKKQPFDMVHCRGHVPSLVGLYLKRKFAMRFLFDMRGFWADEKVDAGAWPLSNPVYKIVYNYFKRKETAFIEEADQVVCLTHKAFDEMQNWKQVKLKSENLTVIPCCVDTTLFNSKCVDQEKRRQIQNQLNIVDDDVILSYLGSIGTWYMLDEMLDFFAAFKKRVPSAKFLFITQDEHERIRKTAKEKSIDEFDIILRPAKRTEVPIVLSLSKFSLFFIKPTYSKISSSPTKQGEIMSMGIPVVCNTGVGDTDMIITKYKSGKLITSLKEKSYQRAIDTLLQSSFKSDKIREGALDFFSLEKGVEQYASIYKKALK